ncbi:MAG: SAM-dependent methyltransferase [Ruminococcaceae bacterium]|nr:SAM-dependent methyltransferase [Oscillospiraceae bacterium]
MNLDKRLSAAAAFVPYGARLADIGSDHAYLPIALCLENKIQCALASDINSGPVASARSNIMLNGLSGRISAIMADGLDGAREFGPDCITVLGMGGELIVSILSKAEWIKDERITLILQPMTHAEILAHYLAQNGFCVIDEDIVCENGRTDRAYRIIKARYNGEIREIDELEAYVGTINLNRTNEDTQVYIRRTLYFLKNKIEGKRQAGAVATYEEALARELKKYIK